jgi:hypothetical protein
MCVNGAFRFQGYFVAKNRIAFVICELDSKALIENMPRRLSDRISINEVDIVQTDVGR